MCHETHSVKNYYKWFRLKKKKKGDASIDSASRGIQVYELPFVANGIDGSWDNKFSIRYAIDLQKWIDKNEMKVSTYKTKIITFINLKESKNLNIKDNCS